jgi:uroporphyrinogen-III synthase
VLVVRGEEGRDWLADALRARGATVEFVAAYRRCPPRLDVAETALLHQAVARPEEHVWHFSSSEAIAYLGLLAQRLQPVPDWTSSQAIASHPRIVQSARDSGFGKVQLVGATIQAVAGWMIETEAARGQARTP